MIDPFTRTQFHPDLKLETWYPEGVLDGEMANRMVRYIGFEEKILDEPFNRFADLSKITAIHLDFLELADVARDRREAYAGRLPVKTAFLAVRAPAYGIARMFGALLEPSPIEVRVFRKIEDAAQWLGVPVQALSAES
jgi:hypothetical protein